MQSENSQNLMDNQSNLLSESTAYDEQPLPSQKSNPSSFDQQPIKSSAKTQIAQYLDENQPAKPKKPIKPKSKVPSKKPQLAIKEQQNKNDSNTQQLPLDDIPIKSNNNVVDQIPVGKSNFNLSQYPDGGDDNQVQQTQYTMPQKLKSKAMKLRLSGLEDLLQLLSKDPNHPDLMDIRIGGFLKQSNPACLEKVLQCFKVWIEKGKQWNEEDVKQAIQSGYINGKPNTKKIAVEIVDCAYQERPDAIQIGIITGLKGKVPKNLAGYIGIVNQLLAIYGAKRMKYLKPYFPQIVRVITNQKLAAVKTQGNNFLKEAYKWMGKQSVQPFIKELKEAIKKQLDTFWQTYDQTQVMTAPKAIQEQMTGKAGGKKLDAYQISDAVQVFKKFNEKWADSVTNATKWNQKTQLMQEFIAAASVPKISFEGSRPVTQIMKRLINDSNFNVVLMDLKMIAVLAKGVRKPFSPFVKSIFMSIISKFRDKKTQMVEQTFHTLGEITYCIALQDVLEDVKQGLSDKAPNMKVNLINWIGKYVDKKTQQQQLNDKTSDALKSLFTIFEKLLSDGTAQVRDAMAKNIAKMKMILGDDYFSKMQNKMDKKVAQKVQEAQSTTKVKQRNPSKDKKLQKDLSKSNLSMKESQSKMSKTMVSSQRQEKQDNSEMRKTCVGIGGKVDISGQIQKLIPKMGDSTNWQKRKEAAEAIINLINQYSPNVTIKQPGEYLQVLKAHINDSNKQLIKVFVNLTGLTFSSISEKQAKGNSKLFITALADGLSDKSEVNRKQIVLALNRIGEIVGKDYVLSIMGHYLEGDNKDSRIQTINFILNNQEHIQKTDTRDFPKGIISCLCDKNKQVRNQAQKLLEKVAQKVGYDIFRSLASKQLPAFTKDLNNLFDKCEKGGALNNSMLNTSGISRSKAVSPARNVEKKNPPTSASNRKKSVSKMNKSFERQISIHEQQVKPQKLTSLIQGDEVFASIKVLTSQRVERQQLQERNPWKSDEISYSLQQNLSQQINSLIRKDLAIKMLSFDYRKTHDSILQLSKICKDINLQGHIRQIYDIILKWVFLKLWGGNPSVLSIIEVLPPVMSILQKKRLVLNQNDTEIVLGIIRQYFISAFMNDTKTSDSLSTIIKCLIVLSSGEKILKKIIKQFKLELGSIHRHVRRQATTFYRQGLAKLIKEQMMEYIGNQNILQEASKIKQLAEDSEFINKLSQRFHENVLNSFGFGSKAIKKEKNNPRKNQPLAQSSSRSRPAHSPNTVTNLSKQVRPTNSKQQQPKLQKEQQQIIQPQKFNQTRKFNSTKKVPSSSNLCQDKTQELDLSIYSAPHPSSPLGKHLAKLLPPNQSINSFFNVLFMQNSQKVSNELASYAKVILGSILKSVKTVLVKRSQYQPDKIVQQINLLQQAIKCPNIIKNADQLLIHVTNFALAQLVYQDENKNAIYDDLKNRGIQYKIENFIKVINGVMLRILQHASPYDVTMILFQLLTKQARSNNPSQKSIYLIIKCITRVSSTFVQQCKPQHVCQYFIRISQYLNQIGFSTALQDFNPPSNEKLKPEDTIINTIKITILDLSKSFKGTIWTYYEKAMSQSSYQDYLISNYLASLNIPYPEKSTKTAQNDDLKKINQLLSKSKTFQAGIEKLKKYIDTHPSFSVLQYFTKLNYDQKFISMVVNAIQGQNSEVIRKTPNKAQQVRDKSKNQIKADVGSETNIQDKIKRLKMKFQELQPRQQQQTITPTRKKDDNQERALQIKRRIDQMKNKMAGTYNRPR